MINIDACVRHSKGVYRWSGEIGDNDPFTAILVAKEHIEALSPLSIDWTSMEIVLTKEDNE